MKRIVSVMNLLLLLGYACVGAGSSDVVSATNVSPQSEVLKQSGTNDDDRAALEAGFKIADKMSEDRIRGIPPPPSQFPLPNYDAGPKRPYPIHVNLYDIYDHYPDYLTCQYDVDEKSYSQSDEPKWFKESLKQIRKSGPEKFPPLKWIAVIIVNRAGWTGESTFEQAHKVGAIFKASDVFDSSRDLSQLVANATMDRHPFFLDPQRSKYIPMEQQRWLIVERHAANAATPNNALQPTATAPSVLTKP
jgi:hypothetical protein